MTEVVLLCKPVGEQILNLAVAPLVFPYTVVTTISGMDMMNTRNGMGMVARSRSQLRTHGAISRALSHALNIVTDLPSASSKYTFARGVVENILRENNYMAPPLTYVNRIELRNAFQRTLIHLEAALQRRRGGSRISQFLARFISPSLANLVTLETLKAEKLSQEILWLAKKLKEQNGLQDDIWMWSKSEALASLALSADPRVQKGIVKAAALIC